MNRRHFFERDRCQSKPMIGASIAAAAAGAAAMYFLYGTKKGGKVRERMGQAAHDIRDKAMEAKERALGAGGDLLETGKEIYGEMMELLKEKREQIKALDSDDVSGLAERLRERWEETKEDLKETLGD